MHPKSSLLAAAAVALALASTACAAAPTPAPAVRATVAAAATPVPAGTPVPPVPATPPGPTGLGDGTYRVGSDMQPGTYRTDNPENRCAWQRLRGFGGTVAETIASDLPRGPAIVTIAPTDVGFQTRGCGTWVKVG